MPRGSYRTCAISSSSFRRSFGSSDKFALIASPIMSLEPEVDIFSPMSRMSLRVMLIVFPLASCACRSLGKGALSTHHLNRFAGKNCEKVRNARLWGVGEPNVLRLLRYERNFRNFKPPVLTGRLVMCSTDHCQHLQERRIYSQMQLRLPEER